MATLFTTLSTLLLWALHGSRVSINTSRFVSLNTYQDKIFGNAGKDLLYGQGGGDSILGGNGVDKIYGGQGVDVIDGNKAPDEIFVCSGDIVTSMSEDILTVCD